MNGASNKLASWLKEERKKARLTMRETARLAGCTHTTICEIELGKRKINLDLAEKITKVFGKKLSDVLKNLEV